MSATLAAYRYRNALMRDIERFVKLLAAEDGTGNLKAYYAKSLSDLRKQLDDVVRVIHLLSKRETEQLIKPV